jgi:hypothetical protein
LATDVFFDYPANITTTLEDVVSEMSGLGETLLVFGSAPTGNLWWVGDKHYARIVSDLDLTILAKGERLDLVAARVRARVAALNDIHARDHWGFHVSAVTQTPSDFAGRLSEFPVLCRAVEETGVVLSGQPFEPPKVDLLALSGAAIASICATVGLLYVLDSLLPSVRGTAPFRQLASLNAARGGVKLAGALLDYRRTLDGLVHADVIQLLERLRIEGTRLRAAHEVPRRGAPARDLCEGFWMVWSSIANSVSVRETVFRCVESCVNCSRGSGDPSATLEASSPALAELLDSKGPQYDYYREELAAG